MKRQVEVFTAGCSVCEPTVAAVLELACPDCEVTVHDLTSDGRGRAAELGINSLPAVVVDGALLSCCESRRPDREELAAAGIGRPLLR